ncbi:hypothetical protein CEXT_55161 [Caerostris extrusa]|uniref:Uncharacterized protein n=1 Tax=Caerostris extrusa TaxID=172846 RepID=A0AAV4WP76_CAEEX|nr:hypothetical protein CEXT_55161 [Caerostris extrusa]
MHLNLALSSKSISGRVRLRGVTSGNPGSHVTSFSPDSDKGMLMGSGNEKHPLFPEDLSPYIDLQTSFHDPFQNSPQHRYFTNHEANEGKINYYGTV